MPRYAIYFLPDGDLGASGAAWLGRDCRTNQALDQPSLVGIAPSDQQHLTTAARRYGFHATLMAPTYLDATVSEDALRDLAERFAGSQAPVTLGPLAPKWIGDFLALVPAAVPPALPDFAFDLVRHFHAARAPLDDADFARRTRGLPARLVRNVLEWGYPYVGDDFRFHMTLSAPVADEWKAPWQAAARAWFGVLLDQKWTIDAISIAIEPKPHSDFHEQVRLPLSG